MLGLHFLFTKYYQFLHKEIENTRYTQSHKITYYYIPTIYMLKEKQKQQVGEKARIVKIDVDTHEELAVKYRIQAVPTFILFKKGEAVWRHSGMIQASELKGVIEQYT